MADFWIDTHSHLDAPEFDPDRAAVIARAREAGVRQVVVSVMPSTFEAARQAAIDCDGAYALGSHPLFIHKVGTDAPERLRDALQRWRDDPRLVAVGEIGLDGFVPEIQDEASREKQDVLYAAQLAVAQEAGLPVILHVRRTADQLLKHLRRMKAEGRAVPGGIAHAFNGSEQQAEAFVELGFCLGFGGAMTFDRALQIRRIAAWLPEDRLVLETDSPDIPPHWLYKTAEARAQGERSRNEPAQLPRIAETMAELRGWDLGKVRKVTAENACSVLPKLKLLLASMR
ncbi:TatD family deoxyribonuclease [Aquabacterium soli]|uniref:TatD family deoxyribonuclease n=1 Tax=Aquabacterium soli TaxID=2493092 RepID=A0A3R8SAB5_9BURK|nr:TatD family hydrolase [Aquabacterium soli]RRS05937.1 TatD family deoxyribonuclease [Aquabacterium soli]